MRYGADEGTRKTSERKKSSCAGKHEIKKKIFFEGIDKDEYLINYSPIIQTHISENLDEIEAVATIFKEYPSYAAVYDAAGLLTSKVIFFYLIISLYWC